MLHYISSKFLVYDGHLGNTLKVSGLCLLAPKSVESVLAGG